jgi:predicted phosphohydrolase
MTLQQSDADFAFVQALPGQKIILKGNHDYWWNSLRKMEGFFAEKGYDTLHILHNNHYAYETFGICGTRGWVNMPGEAADAKVLAREVQRLEVSIQSAVQAGLVPLVFLHYPPIYGNSYNYDILEVLHRYAVRHCYYGHVHGKGHGFAFQGMYEETKLEMISSDYLQFSPLKIM